MHDSSNLTTAELTRLAESAAERLTRAFGPRPLLVQLWHEAETVAVPRGGEMTEAMHVTPIHTTDRAAGEIVLDGASADFDPTVLDEIVGDLVEALTAVDRRVEARSETDTALEALARLATRGLDPGGLRPKRGARIAREIGEQLAHAGLVPDDGTWVADLERAMTLRELGRCLLPSDLWLKPGKLTEGEFELVRSLPDRAAALFDELLPSEAPARWHELARNVLACQGEHWDGGGAPSGKAGEAIPIEARIAAVVGAYDAMTRPRPYGVPRPHAAALSQLQQEAGTHFDPAVVRALAARGLEVDRARAAHTHAPEGSDAGGDLRAA